MISISIQFGTTGTDLEKRYLPSLTRNSARQRQNVVSRVERKSVSLRERIKALFRKIFQGRQ